MLAQVITCRGLRNIPELIFDSQLYYPRTERPKLKRWEYFPDDFETADLNSIVWWQNVADTIAATATQLQVDAVCSPAIVPNIYSDDYYALMVKAAEYLEQKMIPSAIAVLQTLIVRLADLSNESRVLSIASIITSANIRRIYLVIISEIAPRREINDSEMLKGAMRLINLLETNGARVIVGFCSSDLILWKTAGAADCATGKFWNLRRFSPARWDPNDAGAPPIAYWFEESLFTFLREPDLRRIVERNMHSEASRSNLYGQEVLERLARNKRQAWVALLLQLHFEVRTTFLGAADRRRGRIRTALTIAQLAKCNCKITAYPKGVRAWRTLR